MVPYDATLFAKYIPRYLVAVRNVQVRIDRHVYENVCEYNESGSEQIITKVPRDPDQGMDGKKSRENM